jgi:hypothetical protein
MVDRAVSRETGATDGNSAIEKSCNRVYMRRSFRGAVRFAAAVNLRWMQLSM